jgi:hypothetical protein
MGAKTHANAMAIVMPQNFVMEVAASVLIGVTR